MNCIYDCSSADDVDAVYVARSLTVMRHGRGRPNFNFSFVIGAEAGHKNTFQACFRLQFVSVSAESLKWFWHQMTETSLKLAESRFCLTSLIFSY